MSDEEVWRAVPSARAYEVSDHGSVRRASNGRVRSLCVGRSGYMEVALHEKKRSVHRLVAEAFLPPDTQRSHVNHKDGNKTNNRLDNLEWATPSENGKHAYATGLKSRPYGEKSNRARLTGVAVLEIRRRASAGESPMDLATEMGVSPQCVTHVISGRRWPHLPFVRREKTRRIPGPIKRASMEATALRAAEIILRRAVGEPDSSICSAIGYAGNDRPSDFLAKTLYKARVRAGKAAHG